MKLVRIRGRGTIHAVIYLDFHYLSEGKTGTHTRTHKSQCEVGA